MKRVVFFCLILASKLICLAQEVETNRFYSEKNGELYAVEFISDVENRGTTMSEYEFFKEFLKVNSEVEFKETHRVSKRKGFIHTHLDQYYKGIKVIDGGYNFHYKNDKMYFCNGNYVKIENLSVVPGISSENARDFFAVYKMIPIDSISDYIGELIIKEIEIVNDSIVSIIPTLTYKIYLESAHNNNNEIGYVNAKTGKIFMTEPNVINFSSKWNFCDPVQWQSSGYDAEL